MAHGHTIWVVTDELLADTSFRQFLDQQLSILTSTFTTRSLYYAD